MANKLQFASSWLVKAVVELCSCSCQEHVLLYQGVKVFLGDFHCS